MPTSVISPTSQVSVTALRGECRETYKDLLSYARSLVSSSEAAQDIVQQAFTNTLDSIEQGAQIENMGGYLYRCVHNLCVDHTTKEPRLTFPEEFSLEEFSLLTEKSAAASAEVRRHWQEVQGALEQMPPGQRSAFLLAELRGLHYDEIAEVLGRSTASVRQLLNRARTKIRARADVGSTDLTGVAIPALGADHWLRPEQSGPRLGIFDAIQRKVFEVHAWLGGALQQGGDAVLHPASSVVAVAIIVVLSTGSPPTISPAEGLPTQASDTAVEVVEEPTVSEQTTVAAGESGTDRRDTVPQYGSVVTEPESDDSGTDTDKPGSKVGEPDNGDDHNPPGSGRSEAATQQSDIASIPDNPNDGGGSNSDMTMNGTPPVDAPPFSGATHSDAEMNTTPPVTAPPLGRGGEIEDESGSQEESQGNQEQQQLVDTSSEGEATRWPPVHG